MLEIMVSDRDIKLLAIFGEHYGTSKLKFSMTFHSQTDGQTEVVNITLEIFLGVSFEKI